MAVTTEQMTKESALALLGLSPTTPHDAAAITKAYRLKSLSAHPDRLLGSKKRFQQIAAAQDFLLKKETSALSLDETSTAIDVFILIAYFVNSIFCKLATEKSQELLLELKNIIDLINQQPVSFTVPTVIVRRSDYLQKAESQGKYILNNGFTLNANNYTVYELVWLLSRVTAGKVQLQRDLKFKTKSTKLKKLLVKLINLIAKAVKLHAAIKIFNSGQMVKELVGCKLYSLIFITIVGLILQLCWLIASVLLAIKFLLLSQLGASLLIALFTNSAILLATSYLAPVITIVLVVASIRHVFLTLCDLSQKVREEKTGLSDQIRKKFMVLCSALLILILLLLPVIMTVITVLLIIFLPNVKYYLSCFIGYLSILIDVKFNKDLIQKFKDELYKGADFTSSAVAVQECLSKANLTEIKPGLFCMAWDKIFSKKPKDESGEMSSEITGVRLLL